MTKEDIKFGKQDTRIRLEGKNQEDNKIVEVLGLYRVALDFKNKGTGLTERVVGPSNLNYVMMHKGSGFYEGYDIILNSS